MALRLYGDGNIENVTSINTAVSATELGYLDGVTSSLQNQVENAGGLVHISTQSLSSATQAVFDGVFTSTYDVYKAIIELDISTSGYLAWVLRSSSSDVSGNYNGSSGYISVTTGNYTAQNWGTNSANVQLAYLGSGGTNTVDLTISNPALSKNTTFTFNQTYLDGTPIWGGDRHGVATAYDGIRFFNASSYTLTGLISIYGYAKV